MQNISLFLLLFSKGSSIWFFFKIKCIQRSSYPFIQLSTNSYYRNKNPLFSVNGLPLNFIRKINNFLLISKLWMYIYPLKYYTNKGNYKQTQSHI
jgi:hypothetical protein